MRKIKNFIEFYKFERRVRKTYYSIPSYEKLKQYIDSEWHILGEMLLKVNSSDVHKLIPTNSMKIRLEYWSNNRTLIKYNKSEFDKVMKNHTNTRLIEFLDVYISKTKCSRRLIYDNHKDTFTLLLDCIESKYYLDNKEEVTLIMKYLMDEFGAVDKDKVNIQGIDERVKFELEFIKMQREKKQGFNFE